MLSFFKRKHTDDELKRTGGDSTVSADEIQENAAHESSSEYVDLTLSIHPEWVLTQEQQYVYQFLNNDCPPLKRNQLGISGIEWVKDNGGIRVSAFIRNSSDQPIDLEEQTLVMFDEQDQPLAKKAFNLSEIGQLEPGSSRPWQFYFDESDLISESIPKEGWRLTFEIRHIAKEHTLDLPLDWEQGLLPEDKKNLYLLVEQLPSLSPGEVNLFGVDAKQDDDGRIHVVALLRNGSDSDLRIDSIPLTFADASGKILARGEFQLHDFVVKPNTSKPWRFAFPDAVTQKVNLTTWEIQLATH